MDFTNVFTNSNDEEITIPPVYYSIGEINAIPNPMTHTRFLIFSIASSCECIWIQFPHTINCTNASRYTWNFQSGRMYGHSTCFFLWVERDWFHFKSPSDPSVLSLVRSSYLKIANRSNNLLTTIIIDDPTADYIRTMEDICKLWYPDSVDWCSCSVIWKTISCNWTAYSSSSWL